MRSVAIPAADGMIAATTLRCGLGVDTRISCPASGKNPEALAGNSLSSSKSLPTPLKPHNTPEDLLDPPSPA